MTGTWLCIGCLQPATLTQSAFAWQSLMTRSNVWQRAQQCLQSYVRIKWLYGMFFGSQYRRKESVPKDKFVLVHSMNAYRAGRGTTTFFLKLGTIRRWVVSFTLRSLYPRKETRYPSNMSVDEQQRRCGCYGERKKSLWPLSRFRTRGGVVVKALRYKPTGRGFDSRWCHWNFSVT